jgi:hypothetical protein
VKGDPEGSLLDRLARVGTSSAAKAVDQQTVPERSAARPTPRWADPSAVALYLALAFWVTSGLWCHIGALALVNGGSDLRFFEWTLVHATRIFTHGENPFFTPQMNAPDGVNLMANTGLLGLTVPLVPVTVVFGPAVAFTVMLTGGLTATAWAWYHVLSRHIVARFWPAALVGGLFAGFAPGVVNHVNGHPDLVNQFLIPFIVWRALTLCTARDGVVLGLLVTWQAFLNEELLFQTGLAVAVFVVVYAMFRPAEVRARVRPFLAGLWPALLTASVLLAYPLWFQFYGPQSYRGLPPLVLGYGTDLRAFAAFSQLSLVRHGASHSSYGAPPEENTFFGAPLLIAVGLVVVWLRRRVAVRALAAVALVFAVLSLGRTVVIGGRTVLHDGPMSLLDHLQLFDSVVPTRFGLALIPVIAILLAFSVQAAANAPHAWLRYGWTLVLAAALLPIAPTPVLATRAAPVPAFFTSGQWRSYVRDDQSVFAVDSVFWTGSFITMGWDNATGQDYRMVGGYFLGPHEHGQGDYGPPLRPTAELLIDIVDYGASSRITAAQRAAFRADLRYWHAAIVVLGPDAPHHDELRYVLDQLTGLSARQVPGALLWDVQTPA